MKHVTFTHPMLGHNVGDKRLLPDDVAERLEREGMVERNPPDWPARPEATKRPRYRTKEM